MKQAQVSNQLYLRRDSSCCARSKCPPFRSVPAELKPAPRVGVETAMENVCVYRCGRLIARTTLRSGVRFLPRMLSVQPGRSKKI
jgi:hypothetical protein